MHGVPYHTFYARIKSGYSILDAAFFDPVKARSIGAPSGKKVKRCIWEPHGMHRTPTHRTWKAMLDRCLNLNAHGYENYGGRGILVCDQWLRFSNFFADMGLRPKGTTLDRIDTNGNYEPGNCRWADKKTQRRNSRQRMHYMTIGIETLCLSDWCKRLGLRENLVRYRLSKGWSVEKSLSSSRYNNQGMVRGT